MNDTKTAATPGLRRVVAGVVEGRRGLDAAETRQLISALVVEVEGHFDGLRAQVERQRPVVEAAEALEAAVGDLPWVPGTPLARLVDRLAAARRAAPVGPDEPAARHSVYIRTMPDAENVTIFRTTELTSGPDVEVMADYAITGELRGIEILGAVEVEINGQLAMARRSGTTDETGI